MLIGRGHYKKHLGWALCCAIILIAASVWYGLIWDRRSRPPGGGSDIGLTLGVSAALIILFEMMLWPRKMLRRVQFIRTKHWMTAHIWIGLLSVPLVVLHSGFRLGGGLTTALAAVFAVVILSGIYGWIMQNVLPRRLLADVPAETITAQIDHVSTGFADDAERLVVAVCGPPPLGDHAKRATSEQDGSPPYVVVGATRSIGRTQGKTLATQSVEIRVAAAETLRNAFYEKIRPFLLKGRKSDSVLRDPNRAREEFARLRTSLESDAHGVVDALEHWCEQRHQFELQKQLDARLQNWLLVHLPLSVGLVVLVIVHFVFTWFR